MITRLLIAAVGAIVVTAGLLLGMDAVTSLFRSDTGERYFRITDVLPKPPPGRPQRPETVGRSPQRVELEAASPDAELEIEAPAAVDTDAPQLQAPTIEPSASADDR